MDDFRMAEASHTKSWVFYNKKKLEDGASTLKNDETRNPADKRTGLNRRVPGRKRKPSSENPRSHYSSHEILYNRSDEKHMPSKTPTGLMLRWKSVQNFPLHKDQRRKLSESNGSGPKDKERWHDPSQETETKRQVHRYSISSNKEEPGGRYVKENQTRTDSSTKVKHDKQVKTENLRSLEKKSIPNEGKYLGNNNMKSSGLRDGRRGKMNRDGAKSVMKLEKEKVTLIYVQMSQVVQKDFDLDGFLYARIQGGKDVEIEIVERQIWEDRCGMNITLQCSSKTMAQRVVNLLKLSNKNSNLKLICTLNPNRSEVLVNKKEQEEFFEKNLKAITERAEKALKDHEAKVSEAKTRIDELRITRHISLDEYERITNERQALEDKVQELNLQKSEFCTFLKSLKDKVQQLWDSKNMDNEMLELRKHFGVECCRLEAALPMYARRCDIISTVKNNVVCVVLGETGSGKSTQMTQYLYQAGFANDGLIVCTQPRKVAAISLATHVASEMATNVGKLVGYKVGLKKKVTNSTKILYTTDHALLNECLKDPLLSTYSCIIVDEAHERSIYTDLLLGMIKVCLKSRPNLRVIITSATIDPEVFVKYFGGNCPVLKVSGRMFPVEIVWEEFIEEKQSFENYEMKAVKKAEEIHLWEPEGDILVFLTTPLETERCSEKFSSRMEGRTDFRCMVLHGQVQPEEQQLVFQPNPPGKRKIVCATNSAETSITIPGIKYVIDTGLVKEKRYDPRRNMSSLNVVAISRSSAEQRKGRAGRTGPGKCYRLYKEDDYKGMEASSVPEIMKVHLGQAMLKLTELGINPLLYDFVQSPGPSAVAMAMTMLEEIGALKDNKITESGKWLAKLPVEPRLGLIIQKGKERGLLLDSVVLAAVSNAGNSIFYRGGTDEEKEKADLLKTRFCHPGGDSLTLLNVYREWNKQVENAKNKWCVENSINAKSIRGTRETINEIVCIEKGAKD